MQKCKWCKKTPEDFEPDGRSVYFDSAKAKQCKTCRNGITRYALHRLQQEKLLKAQGGICLCGKPIVMHSGKAGTSSTAATVDHLKGEGNSDKERWEDGDILRGISCNGCNRLFGYIDNHENVNDLRVFLLKLLDYIERDWDTYIKNIIPQRTYLSTYKPKENVTKAA
jgi:hypothetical protein